MWVVTGYPSPRASVRGNRGPIAPPSGMAALFGPLMTRFMKLIALISWPGRRRNPGRRGGRG
jgi:hypothetical protein